MIRADSGGADARVARAARHDAGHPLHARLRRLHARSRTATPTAISCSSSARSRSRAPAAASGWCCRRGWRPITAARRCGGCCFSRCDVDALVGIDNHRGVFPIHRSVRFLLVTASAGGADRTHRVPAGRRRSGGARVDRRRGRRRRSSRSTSRRRCSSASRVPDLAIPDLRSADRSRDRRARGGAVSAARQRRRMGGPLRPRAQRHRRSRCLSADRHRRPAGRRGQAARAVSGRARFRPPRHQRRGRARGCCDPIGTSAPRLAYRDVASATNRLTLIAAVLPPHCVSTHTVFCLRTPLPPHAQHLLCGLFNSFVVNYLVRLRVTTHVTTGTVEQLPIPTSEAAPAACREIAALARLLARRRDAAALRPPERHGRASCTN